MKQTNNAIKFLMAQYRAIFKNAYFKGMASAAVIALGMGMAAAPANAAYTDGTTVANGVLDPNDFATNFSSKVHEYTETISSSNQTVDLSSKDWSSSLSINSSGWAFTGDLIVTNGAGLTIEGAESKSLGVHNLTVDNGSSFVLRNSSKTNTSILGYSGKAPNDYDPNGEQGSFNITNKSQALIENSGIEMKDLKLTGGSSLTIGGLKELDYKYATTNNPGVGNNEGDPFAKWTEFAHFWANGTNTITDSTLNLNDYSHLATSTKTTITGASVINFNGSLLDFSDEARKTSQNEDPKGLNYASAFLYGNSASTDITIDATYDEKNEIVAKPTLNVLDNAYGAIYAKKLVINEADINIGNGATFILDGNFTGKKVADAGKHLKTDIKLKNVKFNNNGTLVIADGSAAYANTDASTVTVTGKTDMQGKVNNFAAITVSGATASTPAKLTISQDQLLIRKDTDGTKLAEGIFAGSNSSITLQSSTADDFEGAVLELVANADDGALDLNKDITFTTNESYVAAGSGAAANTIFLYNYGTLKGDHFIASKFINMHDNSYLAVDAKTLELGANDYTAGTLTGLNIEKATVHDNLDVNASGDVFTIDGPVVLSRDYYTKNDSGDYTTTLNDVGRITGDNLKLDSDGSIEVKGGAFVNEGQSLTISSGSLTVGAVENKVNGTNVTAQGEDEHGTWTYYKNANPASLTWTGVFDIAGESADTDATISVKGASGATATLDLTGANVTWGSGSITLQGATNDGDPDHVSATDYFAVGGEGVLTITGNQFSDFLDMEPNVVAGEKTQTKMLLSSGGVLLVEGAVTGAINFNKFHSGTASNAGEIYFNNGGRLVSTGELSLVTGVATTAGGDPTTDNLDLGKGAIIAQGITINNRNPDAVGTDADLADNVVTVSGGALAVASRLATSNNEILFEGASLVLDSNGFTRYGLSATEGGAVSAAKLTFSGSESTFEVSTGDWTVGANGTLGDVDIIDSGNLIVGADAGEYVRNNIGASLQLDNLSLAGDRSTPGDENLIIRDGGELTVNTIQAANTSLSVEGGTLTIKGRELVAADFDSESEPESLVALGEEDGIAQAGIDLTGATINVSNQGHFILGNTAANALVKFQTEATDTADIVEVNAALDEANITLSNGSEFRLDFASGTASTINGGSGLTAKQAAMLKSKLGTFEGGSYVNVGQLALDMEYDEKTLTAQWSDIKDFVQVESDVVNSDIKQLLVQGITSSDEISGHFGAVEADVVGQNTIRVNGNLGLHKARDGYFASVVNANGQRSEVGLTLTSYSTLQLEGEGIVGTLEGQGTNSDSDVVFAEGEYFPGTTTVEGDIRAIGSITVNNDGDCH